MISSICFLENIFIGNFYNIRKWLMLHSTFQPLPAVHDLCFFQRSIHSSLPIWHDWLLEIITVVAATLLSILV